MGEWTCSFLISYVLRYYGRAHANAQYHNVSSLAAIDSMARYCGVRASIPLTPVKAVDAWTVLI